MDNLMNGLKILRQYSGAKNPTCCEHDILIFSGLDIERDTISAGDWNKLEALGFFWSDEYQAVASYKFGNC
jgi:hypothetical protein